LLYLRAIETAAASLAVEAIAVEVHDDAEIEGRIRTLGPVPDGGMIVMPDSFNLVHRRTIIAGADRYRVPAIYYFPLFAKDGGLISYGPDENDMFLRTAGYVDRILKGTKAGDGTAAKLSVVGGTADPTQQRDLSATCYFRSNA
jgi:putative ABC transport system substrate-binding protein